jgi:hypothetical protein
VLVALALPALVRGEPLDWRAALFVLVGIAVVVAAVRALGGGVRVESDHVSGPCGLGMRARIPLGELELVPAQGTWGRLFGDEVIRGGGETIRLSRIAYSPADVRRLQSSLGLAGQGSGGGA